MQLHNSLRKPSRVTRHGVLATALVIVLVTGAALLSEARLERQEMQEPLPSEQAQLRGQLNRLVRYRQLLQQLEEVGGQEEFYLVVYNPGGQARLGRAALRWQDRPVLQFVWWGGAEPPPSGRYVLEPPGAEALHWSGPVRLTLVAGAPAEASAAPKLRGAGHCSPGSRCLRVRAEDLQIMAAALKPGATLLVFPALSAPDGSTRGAAAIGRE